MNEEKKGILLESGTNELEVVEFGIGQNRFAINVIKVKEILTPLPVTKIPQSHACMQGIAEIRGTVVPVIDLFEMLGFPPSPEPAKDKFIVAEFNQTKIVFRVDEVYKIHRLTWEDIEKPDKMYEGMNALVTGIIKTEASMLLLLDFEKIVAEISPQTTFNKDKIGELGERERSNKRLMIVEDSALLRSLLEETLKEAGYVNLNLFENGKDAWEYLESIGEDSKTIEDNVHLIITDIEMPQMDGHHLTKKIKEHNQLSSLPVIIFSSLITDDLRHKGEQVGADSQVSKPEIVELVERIDGLVN